MTDYTTDENRKAEFVMIERSLPERTKADAEFEKMEEPVLQEHTCYRSGDLLIDPSSLAVYREGKILHLGKVEYEMILDLVINAPFCCSRDSLLETAGRSHSHILKNNTLSKHINRIRGKLGSWLGRGYIVTRHSIGYQWAFPVEKCSRIVRWKDVESLQQARKEDGANEPADTCD